MPKNRKLTKDDFESGYPEYSDRKEDAMMELIDGAYDIIQLFVAESPSQKVWKERWLAKARELGASSF